MAQPATVDKVVLITGAARRIGAQIARTLHARGMKLVIHYNASAEEARALQRDLEQSRGNSVSLVQADLLAGVTVLHDLVEQATRAFGRIDVLINNASTFYPTPLTEAAEDDWERLVGTNLKAPFFLAQAAATQLQETRGCIVNIADIYGERPLKRYPIYSIAKAGVIMLTQSLARELGPDVRVNAVAPGAILWPESGLDEALKERIIARTALKRMGTPDDIARTVLFLIDDASYITGQLIPVDGGRGIVQ
ncbi:MAG: pteridine reductase [Acidiferrobacterales bacterium]